MTDLDLETLRQRRLERAFDLAQVVEDVVVVAMPARSGSSWLVETLKQSHDAIHFKGELTPLLRLHGLAVPWERGSEALTADDAATAPPRLLHELSLEAGWPDHHQPHDRHRLVEDTLFRLHLQWPDSDLINRRSAAIIEQLAATESGPSFDEERFTKAVIRELSKVAALDIDFYDFGREPVPYSGALPWRALYESPPYLKLAPWQQARPEDFKGKALIIKSAGDIHRLSFYQRLFPQARLRVIHLARNPAATINGLIDGWRSSKYQSFKVGGLAIPGYSDLGEAWRQDWWKFDLAPGWESHRRAPLAEVCAWQWQISQSTIFDWIDQHQPETFLLKYEELIDSQGSAAAVVHRLCSWLGIQEPPAASSKIMNASQPPRRYRWHDKRQQIAPVLALGTILPLAQRLGYSPDVDQWP